MSTIEQGYIPLGPVESFRPGYLEFGPQPGPENREEALVLACLKSAVAGTDYLFGKQLRSYFYPHNVPNVAILEAAKKNPQILSSYTNVRFRDGLLEAIPYHITYAADIEERIIPWLDAAASHTSDQEFANYLAAVINEFQNGQEAHEEAIATWLSRGDEPEFDFVGGAIDRYLDRRFNRKFAFQAWTGRVDRPFTRFLQDFTNHQTEVWPELAPAYAPKDPLIVVRADITEVYGGLARDIKPSANNLPCEQPLRDRYGSKITFFLPAHTELMRQQRIPLLRKIIRYDIRREWSAEELAIAGFMLLASHEASHSYIRRPGDEENLGRYYIYMNEMYASVLGLALIGLREDIAEDTKEQILALYFANVADNYQQNLTDQRRVDYYDGLATVFNWLVDKGFQIDGDGHIKWHDYRQIYKELTSFAKNLELYVTNGSQQIAAQLRANGRQSDGIRRLAPFRDNSKATEHDTLLVAGQ
ncbi:hypothetical protein HYZ70_00330 [Candidatus Curtissbacteria bacterium]|nr:hypothetical protein [Candidatus Curtissbacteria bacterium]